MTFTFAFSVAYVVAKFTPPCICIFIRFCIFVCVVIPLGAGWVAQGTCCSRPSCNSQQRQQLTCNQNAKKNICYLHNTLGTAEEKGRPRHRPRPQGSLSTFGGKQLMTVLMDNNL